jgi:hypothetical protein
VVRTCLRKRLNAYVRVKPLLHLLSRKINTIALSSSAHSEVTVEGRDLCLGILGRDHVESVGEVKDMVVEGEVVAVFHIKIEKSREKCTCQSTFLYTIKVQSGRRIGIAAECERLSWSISLTRE